jgi:hypothetical protein
MKTILTEIEFRKLCETYGSPDDVPCAEMPEKVAAALSMADRFFDEAESVDEAVRELKRFNVLA